MKGKGKYKTLEQQIQELWASRGLEVLEETFEVIGRNKFRWIIVARDGRYKKKVVSEK